jgi:hypothetical protein
MADALERFLGQVAVIWEAPLPHAVALVVGLGVIWLLLDWRYGAIIGHRDSEISSLKTQRDEYKNKSGGASPDEVKAKLDELAEMTNYTIGGKWPALTPAEVTNLAAKFALLPKRRIQVMYSNYRGKDLAQLFVDALKQGGWTDIHYSEGGGLGMGVSTGRGNGAAITMKKIIEETTQLKVGSFGPDEPGDNTGLFIAVGINAK